MEMKDLSKSQVISLAERHLISPDFAARRDGALILTDPASDMRIMLQMQLDHRARMTVRPGITGLWQISGRSDITDFDEVVKLDMEYIQTWTVKGDIKILFKTIGVVLNESGAR